mgnify:CR=1 FL=1
MAIKTFKPYTPARRNMTVSAFDGVDKKAKPERSLVETLKKNAGRNSYGHITVRHKGGGNKRKYRVIDFKRQKLDMPATVQRIEYDPNRSAFIALIKYEDETLSYILAPYGLKAGDQVVSSAAADIKPGNCLPIANIPVGTVIHNVELQPGHGAQLVRAAGGAAQLMAKEGELAQVRLPSGEVRYVRMNCTACIGQVGNLEHENVQLGNAGRQIVCLTDSLCRLVALVYGDGSCSVVRYGKAFFQFVLYIGDVSTCLHSALHDARDCIQFPCGNAADQVNLGISQRIEDIVHIACVSQFDIKSNGNEGMFHGLHCAGIDAFYKRFCDACGFFLISVLPASCQLFHRAIQVCCAAVLA